MIAGPMNGTGRIKALLATARVANVPSVICNVWVGVLLGGWWVGEDLARAGWVAGCLAAAGVMLYVGGNFLNDWMDRGWDAERRPERALPQGLFTPVKYLVTAVTLLVAGTGVAGTVHLRCGWVAGGIVLGVVIYTVWHKRTAWAVVPMGLCRALLPVMGFLAFCPYVDRIWPVAAALFCYVMGLSLSARYESMANPPRWVAAAGRGLLLLAAVLVAWGNKGVALDRMACIWGTLPYLAWTSFCLKVWRRPLSRLVSGLLAGIPLVDAMLLLPLAVTLLDTSPNAGLVLPVVCFAIPCTAFFSALLLQRLAPAT